MITYKFNAALSHQLIGAKPARENPIPTRPDPQPEEPQHTPLKPKRRKKNEYDIVMEEVEALVI